MLVAVLLILAALASLALASRAPVMVTWLDVGSPGDDAYTTLFFPPESNATETFRWSADHAELSIPVGGPGRYQLDLRIATVRPEGRTLLVSCGSFEFHVPLSNLGADSTAVVDCHTDSSAIDVELDVPVVYLPNGGRPLGVSVRDIQVTALDADERREFRLLASVTIFGSLAGLFLAGRSLRARPFIAATIPTSVLLVGWGTLIDRYPHGVLSAVSGPGGLIALIAGLAAILLREGRARAAGGLALAAVVTGFVWEQPEGILVLESLWVMEELSALVIMPWLAIIAIAGSVMLRGERAHWIASAAALLAIGSLFLPAIAARNVETRIVEVNAPAWTGYGGIAGGIYVIAVLALVGLALFAATKTPLGPIAIVTSVAAIGVTGLLLWRIQIMLFNGDEPHYYTTARSLADDRDLELLNNYVSDHYQTVTYSPVGNIAVERDAATFRYAAGTSGPDDQWLMIPDMPPGWESPAGQTGIVPASQSPIFLRGPDGAAGAPPVLHPGILHAITLEEPCRVSSLNIGQPGSTEQIDLDITVLGADGSSLWSGQETARGEIAEVVIPPEAGLCEGSGHWTVLIEASRSALVQAVDLYNGMQFAGGQLRSSWLFSGLPRDLYGSIDISSRLLLHNTSTEIAQVTIRLITESDQTVSEITVGLKPGETAVEILPVFGATAVMVRVADDREIAASLYGVVDGNRYRIPATTAAVEMSVDIPANARYDAGLWLSVVNPSSEPATAEVLRDGNAEIIEICGICAVTLREPALDRDSILSIQGSAGQPLAMAAVAYEERTGELHYDIGLPLAAAPLALFNDTWPVLLLTAFAGILLAPGILMLIQPLGLGRPALYIVGIVVMLAPFSTYAVRFYTDLVAGTMIVWALVLWERGRQSNGALAGASAIAVALPILHGRLVLLAAGLVGLVCFTLFQFNRERLGRYSYRVLVPIGLLIGIALAAVAWLLISQYAVALGSRGIGNFFRLSWVFPNSFGMLLDRGSGVLPFAPWVLFALAVPRPLHRTQRAALALTILYYGLLMLRAGGWQTWGSPIRYLLPVVPLIALLAIPGMVRLWQSGRILRRLLVIGVLSWSALVSIMLHWLPLSGYVDRTTPGNVYLIDDALGWLPFTSPFTLLPTIEALEGPGWGEPLGIAILCTLAASAAWVAWGIIREEQSEVPG